MAGAKTLEQFVLEETEDGYLITVTAEGGETLAVEATPEQLDAIIEALDDLLTDEDDLIDDEEEVAEA